MLDTMAEWNDLAVIQLQTEQDGAASVPTTSEKLMVTVDIDFGKLQMHQGTSRSGISYIRVGFWKAHSHKCIASLLPDGESNSSHIKIVKSLKQRSIYPYKYPS